MANFFNWLSSCCASNDGADLSTPAPAPAVKPTHPAPAKKDRPPTTARPTRENYERDEPVRTIPMEYVNPETEVPEEAAMKGRRQSTGTLLNHSPILQSSNEFGRQSDDSLRPPSHQTGSQISSYTGLVEGSTGEVLDAPLSPTSLSFNQRFHSLLGTQPQALAGRKCLVLDLDETLVHSSFKALDYADFVIRVEIEDIVHDVYVVKRPGIDEFLRVVSELFEVVIFTASVAKYGDPLLDQLDTDHRIHHRLFRESCYNYNGNYIKDLAQLGRPLEDVIIIDNSPGSYALQPHNAVPVSSWFSDMHDNELLDMLPLLQDLAGPLVPDVPVVLQASW